MSQSEITDAARLIRPILASQLSLCRAVYPSTHPNATMTESIVQALLTFDRLVQAAQNVQQEKPDANG